MFGLPFVYVGKDFQKKKLKKSFLTIKKEIEKFNIELNDFFLDSKINES